MTGFFAYFHGFIRDVIGRRENWFYTRNVDFGRVQVNGLMINII